MSKCCNIFIRMIPIHILPDLFALELQDLKSHVKEPIRELFEQRAHHFELSRLDPLQRLRKLVNEPLC